MMMAMNVRAILTVVAGVVFLGAIIAHIVVKVTLRLRRGGDFDEVYYEFEDRHPGYRRYERASRVTFAIAVVAAMVLFVVGFVL